MADGTFEVTGVLLPYTAMVADIQLNALNVFEGLTTLHPVLTAPLQSSSPFPEASTRSATVECQVTAEPGLTLQNVEEITSGFITPLGDGSAFSVIAGFATNLPPWTFTAEFGWTGPATLSGDLYVLSHTNNTNLPPPPAGQSFPVVFDGFGLLRGITLQDGETLTVLDAGLEPIASDRVSGTVTVAPGAELSFQPVVFLYAHPAPGHAFVVNSNELGFQTANFSMGAPVVSSLPLQVYAFAEFDGGSAFVIYQSVTPGASNVVVAVPTPAALEVPKRQPTDNFQWTAVDGASLYLFQVQGTGTGQPLWSVYTTALTATLPDASRLGLSPLGEATVGVASFASPANVDQLVGDAGTTALVAGDIEETVSSISSTRLP
jgi:hypothetical protein